MLSAAHTCSLSAIAAATGVALLWVWKRFTNASAAALAKRRMRAQLYAMRLFAAEPLLVLRAQRQLAVWTARYLAAMLRPAAVAALPLCALGFGLDSVYGHRALRAGEAAVVTAKFAHALPPDAALEGRGVSVETPPVRLPASRELCWRVRLRTNSSGYIVLRAGGIERVSILPCRPGFPWRRAPSLEISCPSARLNVLGWSVAWPLWFLLVALAVMLLLCTRFGVTL
jgi:hypothetical protein